MLIKVLEVNYTRSVMYVFTINLLYSMLITGCHTHTVIFCDYLSANLLYIYFIFCFDQKN